MSKSAIVHQWVDEYFLQLPNLVVEQLLHYLDVEALLALRLTCSRTKEWAESPQFLPRFQITLRSEPDLNALLSSFNCRSSLSPPVWSNICFLWDDLFIRPRAWPVFLATYAQSLAILDFSKAPPDDTHSRNDAIVDLLLTCTNLRVVKIAELSCPNIRRKKNGLETLIQNWSGSLKSLSIGTMLCPEYKNVNYFGRLLLQGCGCLEELDPPTIALSSPEYLSFNYKLYFKVNIVQPILQFLEERRPPHHHSFKVLHVQEHLFDGDPGLLFTLARSCLSSGTVLHPETFLPFSRSTFMAVPESEGDLFRCLGRLGGINDLVLSLGRGGNNPLTHLTFLSISFRSFFLSDDILDSCDPPLLCLPNLREVEIEMTNDPPWEGRPNKMSNFMRLFCTSAHPSVRKLVLAEVSRANEPTLIRASDVVAGFPGLARLEVSNWDGTDAEFQVLWKGLRCLTHVQIRFCHHLGDAGFQGMTNLGGLRVLILNDVGAITDLSYVTVFRHLPLRSFYHYSSTGCMVTKKGYNSLGTGIFRSTIRQLQVQNSNEFRSLDSFCQFLSQFPKLRRPNFPELNTGVRCASCVEGGGGGTLLNFGGGPRSGFYTSSNLEHPTCCAIN